MSTSDKHPLLKMPGGHAEIRNWLDCMLISDNLDALIADLAAVHAGADHATEPPDSVVDLPRFELSRFLQEGFGCVATEQLSVIMQNPQFLAELRELALFSDSIYRNKVVATTAAIATDAVLTSAPHSRGRFGFRSLSVLAAGLLGAVVVWSLLTPRWQDPTGISGRGFGTPGLLKPDTDANSYVKRLGAVVPEYEQLDMRTSEAVITALEQIIGDCRIVRDVKHGPLADTMITTATGPVSAEQKLKGLCTKWTDDLQNVLDSVRNNPDNYVNAAEETKNILGKMKKRLTAGVDGLS